MIAIVGSGLAGFCAFLALRRVGVDPLDVVVFGSDRDPAGAWWPRAAAIRQRRMRSESDGHCHPASFPGLAVREARRRQSLGPLVQSACDRYHPTVDEFLGHVAELRAKSGWDDRVITSRIERVSADGAGFALGEHGHFQHVLLAPGHPGLNLPPELRLDPRVVHAYEPHDYGPQVTVVGAGLAAATEWLNALEAGASVISVRRREPRRSPLSVARPYFSRRALAEYQRLPAQERMARLRTLLAPSYPPGRRFDDPLATAAKQGRFRVAEVVSDSGQIICATGFRRGFHHDPLLRSLVREHGLETHDGWIELTADSTVAALTDATRTLALAGAPAQWTFPAADTLAGAKYAARRFARRVAACPTR